MYSALGIQSVLAGLTSPSISTSSVPSKCMFSGLEVPCLLGFDICRAPFISLINPASQCAYTCFLLVVHALITPSLFPTSISSDLLERPSHKLSFYSVSSLDRSSELVLSLVYQTVSPYFFDGMLQGWSLRRSNAMLSICPQKSRCNHDTAPHQPLYHVVIPCKSYSWLSLDLVCHYSSKSADCHS